MAYFDQKGGLLIDNDACRQQLSDNWPMVCRIAAKLAKKMHGYWSAEELASFGYDGLADACRRYDPQKGPWVPYAALRIRGAILDAISVKGWHYLERDEDVAMNQIPNPCSLNLTELRDEIRSALGFAKPRSRRFIQQYYIQGLELSEVGKLNGITASAVCHALTRSMNHLRKTLDSSRTVSRLA